MRYKFGLLLHPQRVIVSGKRGPLEVTKLKRARNSLLNVVKIPPEVLGNIFCWNVALKEPFGGVDGAHPTWIGWTKKKP